MITIETYADLPRILGHHAFIVLSLLQAADMMGVRPVTEKWLFDRAPGYGINSIGHALRKLTDGEKQFAKRVPGGWVLNKEGAFQLPLGYALVEGENHSQSDSHPPVVVDVESNLDVSSITATTTTTRAQNHSHSDSRQNIPAVETPTESEILRRENLAAFKALGIVGRRPQKVAALEWVTPDYIRAIVADAKKRPGIDNPEGFALTRMEDEAPMPENSVTGKENRTGYNGSAFAELLQRDDDDERVSVCCWQDDLPEIFKSGPYQGKHMKARRCGKPCKAGSYKWCEEHYEIGTATYDSESEEA